MSVGAIRPIARRGNPFPQVRVRRDSDGVLRYADLPASLVAVLEQHAGTSPDAEAVVELGGPRLTYADLWRQASRVAGGLRAAGVGRGDRVAVRYAAGADWVVAFVGTMMAGGIAVLPNIRSLPDEMNKLLEDAGVVVDLAVGTPLPEGDPYIDPALGPTDPAAMFFTSGTTGRPKGVPTTQEAFLTSARNMLCCMGIPAQEWLGLRTLISVPLFHVTGCCAQLVTVLLAGGTSVIMPALDRAGIVAALRDEHINFIVTVPAVYALLIRREDFAQLDRTGVRWVGYGGAAIAPWLVHTLKAAFADAVVFNGYGMTETASIMTVLPDSDACEHADSVGFAVPTVELAVRQSGEDADVGELLARGANVMTGYWNRPEETAHTLADGWMHTGDIVKVDEQGRIYIIDRAKDIIIRGGENVSSIEVEGVLAAAPGVLEAAVLAVPDEIMGEKVGAVLVGGADGIDLDAVVDHCREHLADFKVPQYAHFSATPLPRNAGGKVLKGLLRDGVEWGKPLR